MMRTMFDRLRRLGPLIFIATVGALWAIPQIGDAELSKEPSNGAAKVLNIDLKGDKRTDGKAKDEARRVASAMVCLCGDCPRYNLGECACGWANTGRRTIELALLNGMAEQDIIDGFVKAYDFKVLDALPNEGFGRVSYLVPYAASVLGLLAVVFIGMRLKRRVAGVEEEVPEDDGSEDGDAARILEQELDDLD